MRSRFERHLEDLHTNLIHMGGLCEVSINRAVKTMVKGDQKSRDKSIGLEREIGLIQRDIEQLCIKLLLHEQPVAGDLRRITAAQYLIVDMYRIGNLAADVAEVCGSLPTCQIDTSLRKQVNVCDMGYAVIQMVTDSIDAFVQKDEEKAQKVIEYDVIVDGLFAKIKGQLIDVLVEDSSQAGECLDLLMIAKYFERIGDHAENIGKWVLYYVSGTKVE